MLGKPSRAEETDKKNRGDRQPEATEDRHLDLVGPTPRAQTCRL